MNEMTGAEKLAAAVIRTGMMWDGPDYFRMPCGREWAGVAGLDPAAMYAMAAKGGPHERLPYEPWDSCWHRKETTKPHNFACRHGFRPISEPMAVTVYRQARAAENVA